VADLLTKPRAGNINPHLKQTPISVTSLMIQRSLVGLPFLNDLTRLPRMQRISQEIIGNGLGRGTPCFARLACKRR